MLIYLAAPYSHLDPKVVEERMENLCAVDAILMQRGVFTFSPLLKHFVAQYANLPTDWNYWKKYCQATLPLCDCIYVLTLKDWQESTGVKEEIKLADSLMIPVYYIDANGNIIN